MSKELLRVTADKVVYAVWVKESWVHWVLAGARLPTEYRRHLLSKQRLVLASDKRSSSISRGSQAPQMTADRPAVKRQMARVQWSSSRHWCGVGSRGWIRISNSLFCSVGGLKQAEKSDGGSSGSMALSGCGNMESQSAEVAWVKRSAVCGCAEEALQTSLTESCSGSYWCLLFIITVNKKGFPGLGR